MGEALTEQRRLAEAAEVYAESMALNRQLGSLVGQGVCHAIIGDLLCRQQRYQDARIQLDLALDIARRVDNPWREAWTLLRLSRVAEAAGDARAAAALSQDGHAIFARITPTTAIALSPQLSLATTGADQDQSEGHVDACSDMPPRGSRSCTFVVGGIGIPTTRSAKSWGG